MQRDTFIRNLVALMLVALLGLGGYLRSQSVKNPIIQGETMGTSYSITLSGRVNRSELEELPKLIQTELGEINRQMSTWDPNSEISAINRSDEAGPYDISPSFATVIDKSILLSRATRGAFDPTLNPLLNLWGFGSEIPERKIPSDAEIAATREKTGWDKIWLDENRKLWKAIPRLELNLGAIAKGHGVDQIARLLSNAGYENWFVEIGGEVVVRGNNPDGDPWRIGIQFPSRNPMDSRLQGIIYLTGGAVATSGDYRNYIEEDGATYSHILDPRSGRTVLSDTASVTVTAPSCMEADGVATALFVMGPEEGLPWIEEQPALEAMLLVRDKNGKISELFSSGFKAATSYSSIL